MIKTIYIWNCHKIFFGLLDATAVSIFDSTSKVFAGSFLTFAASFSIALAQVFAKFLGNLPNLYADIVLPLTNNDFFYCI